MFYEIKFKSQRYKNSFFPHAITSWNIIIPQFQDMPSFNVFKNYILHLIRPPIRSIFGIYDVIGTRRLYQLRLGLSPLNDHKWKHNFKDLVSSNCLCNEDDKNTRHFLLFCSFFASQRLALMEVGEIVGNYDLAHKLNQESLFLYGDSTINATDNRKILMSTIKYIKNTKRFSIQTDYA